MWGPHHLTHSLQSPTAKMWTKGTEAPGLGEGGEKALRWGWGVRQEAGTAQGQGRLSHLGVGWSGCKWSRSGGERREGERRACQTKESELCQAVQGHGGEDLSKEGQFSVGFPRTSLEPRAGGLGQDKTGSW